MLGAIRRRYALDLQMLAIKGLDDFEAVRKHAQMRNLGSRMHLVFEIVPPPPVGETAIKLNGKIVKLKTKMPEPVVGRIERMGQTYSGYMLRLPFGMS